MVNLPWRTTMVAAWLASARIVAADQPTIAQSPAQSQELPSPADVVTEEIVVTGHREGLRVSGRSGPWSIKANPRLPYGTNDARPPLVVPLTAQPHERVEITAEGFATLGPDWPPSGPEGLPGSGVNGYAGAAGNFYPSRYIDPRFYPVNLGALIACFVDAEGHLVSRPFPVGKGVRAQVPEGATALSFGFNDDVLRDNRGALLVSVVRVQNPAALAPEAPQLPAAHPLGQALAPPPAVAARPPAGYLNARVDARASPWSRAVNPGLAYGTAGGDAPVVVVLEAGANEHLQIVADGTTTCDGAVPADAGGIAGDGVDAKPGASGHGFPSRYLSPKQYPALRHALLATFVDAVGKAVSRPVLVGGDGVRVGIPAGAVAVALGFNDEDPSGCSGTLAVTIVEQERAAPATE